MHNSKQKASSETSASTEIRGNEAKMIILDELSDPLQIERMKLSSSVHKTTQLFDTLRKYQPSKLAEDLISVQPIIPNTFENLLKALEEAENKACKNETPLLESIIQCRLQPSVSRKTATTISTS